MTSDELEEVQAQYIQEHYRYYRDFVKTITYLSGATIPIVLSVARDITPTPRLLQCVVLGSLIALVAGLVCIRKTVQAPLEDIANAIRLQGETARTDLGSETPRLAAPRVPKSIERRASIVQLWAFGGSLLLATVHFLCQ